MTFKDPIVDDVVLMRPAIQSPDYVPGVSGWSIREDGTAEFNDLNMRGAVLVGAAGAPGTIYVGPAAAAVDFTTESGVLRGLSLDAGVVYRYGTGGRLIVQGVTYATEGSDGALRTYLLGPDGILARPIEMIADAVGGVGYLNLGQGCTDVTLQGRSMGRGRIDAATSTSTLGDIGTTPVIALTVPGVRFESGRAYRIEVGGAVNADVETLVFRQIIVGGVVVHDLAATRCPAGGSSIDATVRRAVRADADIIEDVELSFQALPGGGLVSYFASATSPRWLSIDDVGAAADFPEAVAL